MQLDSQITSRRVYTGKVVNLDIDVVRYENGSVGEVEMVRHPGSSAVVPFLSDPRGDDPQILLLRQYRHAAARALYEIPAGRLLPGEDPKSCAERELAEETGCSAAQMEHLFSFFTTPGFTDERIHLFLAAGLTRGATRHEPDEFIDVVAKPLSTLLAMTKSGEIDDAKTALALLYVAGFRFQY